MASTTQARPDAPASLAGDPGVRLDPVLAQLFEDLPDGVVLLNRDWQITYANKSARAVSRIQPQHINGPTHWEVYPETLGTIVEQDYREVMASRIPRTMQPFFWEPHRIWFSIRILPVESGIALYYRDATQQYLAEEARAESEDRLRLALAASNGVGIWDWDVPNDLVYADAAFAHLYGVLPHDAAKGVPIAHFTRNIVPEDMAEVGPAIQLAVRDASEFSCHYRIVQADGSLRWVSARGRCSHDASGKPLRFSGVIIDITDQKRQEEDLRSSEERYRVLTELSPQSQWMANAQGQVLYANRRFLNYIGHDFVPRTGEEYIDCFDPEDRARVLETWTRSVSTGEDYVIDARLIRASDRVSRWWHLRALPIRNENGLIQQWLGSATDIHDARMVADRLIEKNLAIDAQRAELEAIYASSPIGLSLYSPDDFRILRINQRNAEVLGRTPETAVGKTLFEVAPQMPAAHALFHRAAAGEAILGHIVQGELPGSPGVLRTFNVNYTPLFDEHGAVRAIATASLEITDQKRAEAALIQSEKLAAVGRMASSIAHEINNPLESVTNLIYIARTYAILPEVQNMLDLADQELRRVSIIANQTLRFHKQATSPREISCTDLYTTVLSLYEGRLRNSAISVEKRKRAARLVYCFEGDIRQVLNNLVGNAIDAMPTGGRLVLRSREAVDWRPGIGPPRRGLVLTIADTGNGISAATRRHLFEPFFTTKGINGNGLGLWISAEIVERHHGRLLLRSSQNPAHHGTVFSLFLPFPDPAPATEIIQ